MPYLLYGNTSPPPPTPFTHDTPGFKTIWVPTHRGTLYPKRERKVFGGRVSQKEAGKRKVISWIHSLWLLVDDDDDEWVVAEKGKREWKKRIKEEVWSNDTKTKHSQTDHKQHPKKSFCQKGEKQHPKLRLSKRANHWKGGGGWGEEPQQSTHDLLIIICIARSS